MADNGIGIPPDDLPRLFERYYRGGNVSGIVGTGVGLNLVKMLVDLHGGDIAVDSTEGKGTRVTIRLPTVLPAQPDARPKAEESSGNTASAAQPADETRQPVD